MPCVASMEPPPFGSGNPARGSALSRGLLTVGLQWSHRLSAVETGSGVAAVAESPRTGVLQWSHRLSAVETCVGLVRQSVHQHNRSFNGATAFRQWKPGPTVRPSRKCASLNASMEPPPFGSGNRALTDANEVYAASCVLQWSHRLSAVETLEAPTLAIRAPYGLQWSHRLSAVETGRARGPDRRRLRRFNGATAFRQWKHVRAAIT